MAAITRRAGLRGRGESESESESERREVIETERWPAERPPPPPNPQCKANNRFVLLEFKRSVPSVAPRPRPPLAAGMSSGTLFTYPEISTIAGLQGLIVYGLASSLPILVFGYIGPVIRRKCPNGFVLTEWTRQRYGMVAGLYLSTVTLITLFLYMVGELSGFQQLINVLTGLNGLPPVIVEVAVTTIYMSLGGFKVSFITDNIQGAVILLILIIGTITVGTHVHIDRAVVRDSDLLRPSLLGWQLIYILPVAVLTNDFFLSQFWMRTFASRTDRDLRIGTSLAAGITFVMLLLIGCTGLLAAWSGAWPGDPPQEGSMAFFSLLEAMPAWVIGIVLVLAVFLSSAVFDSLQSAMISTGSNDLFRNRLPLNYIRVLVVLVCIPVIVVALKSPSVLQISLVSDLVSAATIPVLVVGLWDKYFYWWSGLEVVVGGLGGIFSVFLFGCVYYHGDTWRAGRLLLLEDGLYANDWSAFGAFVAAPVGGLVFAIIALLLRIAYRLLLHKLDRRPFDMFDRKEPPVDLSLCNPATGGAYVADQENGLFASAPPIVGVQPVPAQVATPREGSASASSSTRDNKRGANAPVVIEEDPDVKAGADDPWYKIW
ncbi:hypothetical protein KEM52_002374 [Ascosphaera acerosa]|nr:hypothetical protein KEM52_002374 [Ascosphaera acerosa]